MGLAEGQLLAVQHDQEKIFELHNYTLSVDFPGSINLLMF